MEAFGSACHRLLGLLTGSALTGSGVDRSGSLTGPGQTSGSGQRPGRVDDWVRDDVIMTSASTSAFGN